MSRSNTKTRTDHRLDRATHVAGGVGAPAAKQGGEALLRRAVLANLLWEDVAYQDGETVTDAIQTLVPQVQPETVAQIAVEARTEQRLRHVPLLLARECARHKTHRHVVDELLPQIVRRPDELTEFLALYWQDGKDQPIAASAKRGLAQAFTRFDAYQLAKYNQDRDIRLRDVMFLTHPKPKDQDQANTWRQLVDGTLPVPDTWEVALSAGSDKRATWERLITDGKLGALAFLRNLRNMEDAGVSSQVIRQGFKNLRVDWLLPLNFFAAAQHAPRWLSEIEQAMFASLAQTPKLEGHTHLIVDVSGSMQAPISGKSKFNRLEAAAAMAVLAREMCESVTLWATAGSDWGRKHQTEMLKPHRGFALSDQVVNSANHLGGGGIFTRQALDYIRTHTDDYGDRTIVFSDSQDIDGYYNASKAVPKTFSPRNYIVDVSAHTRGINYKGVWDAEISGWSESFLRYIQALEAFGT